MKTVMLISPKDNNFYNFRRELILKLRDTYKVILVCPYGKKIDYFTERGCEFIDTYVDRRGTNPFNDMKLIHLYIKILKTQKPDVVLTYTTKTGVYPGIACRLTGTKYIVNNAGLLKTEPRRPLIEFILYILYKLGYGGASQMMFQNTEERNYFRRILSREIPYHDIPGSGVNTSDFVYQPYPEESEEIVFNFVARIVKIKGIDEYIECAKRIKNKYPQTHFVIYGDYDSDEYRSIVDDLVRQGVIEYGGIQLDMKPFIAKASAVIHPSYYEGMTNVILEHSAVGRPCIASNIPGCREGVDDGKTGFLFECKNVDDMVEKVEKFIKLPYEERKAMGLAARRKMEIQFERSIVTNTYLMEIKNLIGE